MNQRPEQFSTEAAAEVLLLLAESGAAVASSALSARAEHELEGFLAAIGRARAVLAEFDDARSLVLKWMTVGAERGAAAYRSEVDRDD